VCVYIYISYKITYSVASLSYDNYYVNLRDYSNSLLCELLKNYGKYPHVHVGPTIAQVVLSLHKYSICP
jgi:hypothetical protein